LLKNNARGRNDIAIKTVLIAATDPVTEALELKYETAKIFVKNAYISPTTKIVKKYVTALATTRRMSNNRYFVTAYATNMFKINMNK